MSANCTRCNMSARPRGTGRVCLYCESEQTRDYVRSHPATRAEFLRAMLSDRSTPFRIRCMLLLNGSPRVHPVNTDLMIRTLDRIEREPDNHVQSIWAMRTECGTAFCVAGHAMDLSGARFDWEPGNYGYGTRRVEAVAEWLFEPDGERVPVNAAATRALGLLSNEAAYLFAAGRTRDEVNRFGRQLVAFQQTYDSLPERVKPFRIKPDHPAHRRWRYRTGRERSPLRMPPIAVAEIVGRLADRAVSSLPGLTADEAAWLASSDGSLDQLLRAELARC